MIYVWALGRVEDPERWKATLEDPIPGVSSRLDDSRMAEREMAQLKQLGL